MAANKLTIEVLISDNGTAKLVQKGVEGVGKATENTTKKTKEASKAQDELNYKLNQGATGVSSAARSFSKLNQAIGNGPNGLVGAYATLAANAFAVSAAFNTLREAAQVEAMLRGLEVQGARTGRSLTTLSKELQQMTNYSISAAEAMQATALMSSAGFSSQGMRDLTEVANNAALALGRNVPDALDRISKGVTKLEPELLDELGIMTKLTEAQAAYALENNKSVASLTSFEKRQAMLNAVVAEGTAKFGGLSDQVQVNPYDQLAATFNDLSKNVLGFVNTILGPVASIFGGSQGMLLGGVILFASSIKKQLMPALFEMSKNASKAKEAHLEEAEAIKKKTAATLADAKAKKDSALIDARTKTGTIAGAALPKKFRSEEIKQGALSVKELNEELKRLDSSIRARQTGLEGKGAAAVSSAKVAQKEAELKLIEKERENLAKLIEIETKGEVQLTPLRKEAREGRLQYIAATRLASVEGKKAQALEAAAAGDLKDSWNKAKEAALEYRKATVAQSKVQRLQADGTIARQGTLSKIEEKTSNILGTAGIFAQTAAAGFMKFLPYIGIATTALSGAWSVYKNFIQSEAEKAKIESLKKLREVLDNTTKSVKELNRLNEASVPAGIKAAQTLVIQSNATAQIAESFKEVQEASAKAAKNTKTDSFWKALIGSPEDAVSYASGIAKDSSMFKPIADEFTNSTASYIGTGLGAAIGGALGSFLGPVGTGAGALLGAKIGNQVGIILAESLPEEFNGIDEEAVASYQAIDQLSKILRKDLVDSMVEAAGGADKLANSPALRANFINQASEAYKGVADSIKSLQEGFKQTSTAITEFMRSSVKATPFDGIVKGYESVNKAFRELDTSIGGSNLTDQIQLLSSMPEEMIRMLDLPQQQLLKSLSEQTIKINENKRLISELQAKGEDMTSTDRDRVTILTAQNESLTNSVALYSSQANEIKKSLERTEADFRIHQARSREFDNQLKLINAIASANSEYYSMTAEGETARIARHNQAIELQQSQLRAQISIQKTYIQQTEALIAQLEVQKQLLSITDDIDAASLRTAQTQAQISAQNARSAALAAGLSEKYIQSLDTIITNAKTRGPDSLIKAAVGNYGNITGDILQAAQTYFNAAKTFELAVTRTTVRSNLDTYNTQIAEFRQNIKSLTADVAALDQSKIGSAQEKALVDKISASLKTEEEKAASEILKITRETEESLRSALILQRNSKNITYETIRAKAIEARQTSESISMEATQNIRRLKAEGDVMRGRLKDHAQMAELERRSLESAVSLNDSRIAQEEKLLSLRLEKVQADLQLVVLESLIGNGLEDSTSKLLEVVSLEQKRLDLLTDTADKQSKIAQGKSELAILRTGGSVDERTQKQFAVENAKLAWEAAKRGQELRLAAIDAEYDLIEAKRKVDEDGFKVQALLIRSMWEIFNGTKPMSTALEQNLYLIEDAAKRIQNVNTDAMRQAAKQSTAQDVMLARIAYEKAIVERDTIGLGGIGSAFANRRAQRESRARTATTTDSVEQATLSYSEAQLKTATRATTTLIAIQENTANLPDRLADAISTAIEGDRIDRTPTLSGRDAMSQAMRMAEQAGAKWWQFGAQTGHEGKGHKEFRAIDVYAAPKDQEVRNPAIKARFDRLAIDYAQRGYIVIWNKLRYELNRETGKIMTEAAKGHTDHMHVEAAATGKIVSESFASGGAEAASAIQDGIVSGAYRATETLAPTEDQSKRGAETVERAKASSEQSVITVAGSGTGISNLETLPSKMQMALEDVADAFKESMNIMDTLASQMSERLGRDFGPQGKVLSTLSTLMQALPNQFSNLNTSFNSIKTGFDQWKAGCFDVKTAQDAINSSMKELNETGSTSFSNLQTNLTNLETAQKKSEDGFSKMAQGAANALSAISTIVGMVGSLLKASSDAKIANIDREIAAEQKRDGKSAQSVAKIEALEKKKDSIARKSFNVQKKLMMAQAVMSTAAAIAGQLASPPVGPWNIALAAMMGAMGLAQVAIISGMQYESSYSPKSVSTPSSLSIGKRGDSVNLAGGPNANAGGEVGYLRGAAGTGTNASNYRTVGSAYGGEMMRGYGNRGFVVGEKGPEVINPETPISVTPANDVNAAQPINANISIQALDGADVKRVLVDNRGNIIQMLREAANNSGQRFLEDVNVNVYTRPNIGKL